MAKNQELKLPTIDVDLHILAPGNVVEHQKGKHSTLSIRGINGTARLAPPGTIKRINRKPVRFRTLEEYQHECKKYGGALAVHSLKGRMERYAMYRKDSFWPVYVSKEDTLAVSMEHSLVMKWLVASYKWGLQRAAYINRQTNWLAQPNRLFAHFSNVLMIGLPAIGAWQWLQSR